MFKTHTYLSRALLLLAAVTAPLTVPLLTVPAVDAQETAAGYQTHPLEFDSSPKFRALADFDGDGKAELLISNSNGRWSLAHHTEGGLFKEQSWNFTPDVKTSNVWSADFNADNNDDLLIRSEDAAISIALSNGLNGFAKAKQLQTPPEFTTLELQTIGDVNGDRRAELIFGVPGTAQLQIASLTDDWQFTTTAIDVPVPVKAWEKIAAADLNGNGSDDLLIYPFYYPFAVDSTMDLRERWGAAFSNNQLRFSDWQLWARFPPGIRFSEGVLTDSTGDGRAELAAWAPSSRNWWVAYSRGSYAVELPVAKNFRADGESLKFFSGDVNGDKQDDIVAQNQDQTRSWLALAAANDPDLEDTPKNDAAICLNYHPQSNEHKWGRLTTVCPDGYAIYETDDVSGRPSTAAAVNLWMTCCKLPSADILDGTHVYAADRCPDSYIATGQRATEPNTYEMRCTKLNTKRYQLGERLPARYFGAGTSMYKENAFIHRSQLPIALRHGLGRKTFRIWDSDGCIGQPWASLLSAKAAKSGCGGFLFQQLQYSGKAGDPAAGVPVTMYPNCPQQLDPFNPLAKCSDSRPHSLPGAG